MADTLSPNRCRPSPTFCTSSCTSPAISIRGVLIDIVNSPTVSPSRSRYTSLATDDTAAGSSAANAGGFLAVSVALLAMFSLPGFLGATLEADIERRISSPSEPIASPPGVVAPGVVAPGVVVESLG